MKGEDLRSLGSLLGSTTMLDVLEILLRGSGQFFSGRSLGPDPRGVGGNVIRLGASSRRESPGGSRRVVMFVLGVGILTAPFLFHLSRIPEYGRLQRDDYYGVVVRMCEGGAFLDTPSSFYESRINQHRVAIPALIWRLNVAIFHGDNRVTAFLALGFLTGILALCLRRLPRNLSAIERITATGLLALALTGPQLTYNLVKSFGGVHYFLADLLVLGAVSVFLGGAQEWTSNGSDLGRWLLIWGLGLMGILTFSSGLGLWPALILGCWWTSRDADDWFRTHAGAFLAGLVFLDGFQASPGGFPRLGEILEYLLLFVGGFPRWGSGAAHWVGGAGLFLLVVLVSWTRRRGDAVKGRAAFWLMVATYALSAGILASLGRAAGRGTAQALTERYLLFSGLFWASLGVVALVGLSSRGSRLERSVRLLVPLGCLVFSVSAGMAGLDESLVYLERGLEQQVTEVQLRHGAWDRQMILHTVTRFPPAVVAPRRQLLWKSLEHVPWDRPGELPDERRFDPDRVGPPVAGAFDEIAETVRPDVVRVGGWMLPEGRGVREVVFFGEDGRQRSVIRVWPDPRVDGRMEWSGIVAWEPEWEGWIPYVIDERGGLRPFSISPEIYGRWRRILAKHRGLD